MARRWLMLPLPAGKPWHGGTPYAEALGGSESAVAFLAQALYRQGEEVTVLSHGAPGVAPTNFMGVNYILTCDQAMNEMVQRPWDVVLSSRWVEALGAPWNTKVKLFWTHDLPQVPTLNINAHKAVCLSKFHAGAWQLPSESVEIIGDGIELTHYRSILKMEERNQNKVLWISNPDRGLALAAKIFQQVRQRWPDLELHVYGRASVYGWPPEQELPFLPRRDHMQNVFLHDPLNKMGLARELGTAWAVFYPTFWPETYCIATLEAQAAGTPVIASPYGALNETVRGGILTYDFLNAFSQLRNKRRWTKLSETGREWAIANTWDVRAEQWIKLVEEVSNGPSQ